MKFYDMALAPSPRRVRMFIAEKNIDIPSVQVDLRGGEHLRPEFSKLNPWCTVPVLELDDGTCISEAIACCRYLEAAYPEPPLMGATPVEQGVIAMWEHRVEWDGFIAGSEVLPALSGDPVLPDASPQRIGVACGLPNFPYPGRFRKLVVRHLKFCCLLLLSISFLRTIRNNRQITA